MSFLRKHWGERDENKIGEDPSIMQNWKHICSNKRAFNLSDA